MCDKRDHRAYAVFDLIWVRAFVALYRAWRQRQKA